MKRSPIPILILTFTLSMLACSLSGEQDFSPTETAIAARVMTQVAQSDQEASPPDQASPENPSPPAQADSPVTLAVTAPYVMAFHACDTSSTADCHDPRQHMVYLAQSNDGESWSLLPDWQPYPGSVPDVIRRGNTLYIYSARGGGQLVRYHLDTNVIEAPVQVTVADLPGGFVDPSLFVDEAGRLALFFLYGQPGSDPAGCAPDETSCIKEIGSATEVEGSDGAEFALDEGQRISVTISPSSNIKSASDPDIFFDGQQYVLYLSQGASTSVWVSTELRGEYIQEPALSQGLLTFGTGGVPAGYFDSASGQYWTYAHIDQGSLSIIRRAVHADFFQQLNDNDFATVLTGESVGLGADYLVASPGFAVNTSAAGASPGQPPSEGGQAEAALQEQWLSDGIILEPSDLDVPTGMPVADVSAILLPDGRIRLYAFAQEQGVRSLISTDGVDFTPEDGIRVDGGMPRAVALEDGAVRLFYIAGGGVGSAISSDGLNFTPEEGLRITNEDVGKEITPPAVIQLPDGRYRAYFSDLPRPGTGPTPHQVFSAISDDMLNWVLEDGVRIGEGSSLNESAEHPAALLNSDGSVTLFYCNNNVSPGQGGPTAIYAATSSDGLTFTQSESTFLNGCDPDIFQMPDGKLRMYYGNFDPSIGGVILTAQLGLAPASPPGDFASEGGPVPGGNPVPEFNPFEEMAPEQEACLRDAWGDEAFEDIAAFQRPPTEDEEPAFGECLGDVFAPPGDAGGEPPGGGNNAFVDQTYYATSTDGLNWDEGIMLADKASVPDIIRTSDGALWAYWVDFTYMTGPNMELIGIARSDDDGQSWELLGNVNFTGIGDITPVDPDVIELPDGRTRMYFYDIAVRQREHPIYSAISSDGINFTLEEGVRILMDDVYDPDVIQLPDSTYRMYLNSGDILSASSPDGLVFTADEGVRVENGSVPGSIVLSDGVIRMYNCQNGISVYESQDGLSFSLLEQGVIRDESGKGQIICDPSVTAIPGGYVIVYKTNPGANQ